MTEGQELSRKISLQSEEPLKVIPKEQAEALPVIASISELYLDETQEQELVLIIPTDTGQKRVPISYRELYWPQYNSILKDAFEETAETPDLFERTKQEKLLKAMVNRIAGVSVNSMHEVWAKMGKDIGELLRRAFFKNTGEFRISEVMVKNLKRSLDEETGNTDSGNKG